MTKFLALCLLLPALALAVLAQDTDQDVHPRVATVTFHLVWEQATPQEYTIRTQADGASTYVSRNPFKPVQPGEEKEADYLMAFTMSATSQYRIFKLAKQANFFKGDFDYKNHPIANTGQKTLTYADVERNNGTKYNHSENKAIQELTDTFEGISATIEHGRKLQFLHRYDKLGLEAELKAMEDAASSHFLAEIQAIAATLKSIAEDPAVLNIARQRARRLLAKAEK
jgi:hypothetical protein